MALIKEYFDLTKKYIDEYGLNTLLLMQVGSFMECYGMRDKTTGIITGSKIEDFTRICDLNIANKNICIGKENVVMAGFIVSILEKYLKKLQDSGFTIVVVKQDEQMKKTSRSLAGIFSPGTYFPFDDSSNTKLSNNIICIWIEQVENKINLLDSLKGNYVYIGISNINILTGETSIYQFKEIYSNNPCTYDQLERFISIYNPSEVIIISNLEEKIIDSIINFSNILCKSIHKISILKTEEREKNTNELQKRAFNCEKQIYQKEILEKFFQVLNFDVFIQNFYENVYATQSFCFLLDFVFQHNPYLVKKIKEPIFENNSNRLILANHSLKQLNIIDDDTYNGKYSSVSKMLNLCITAMGKRRFNHDFLNPTTDIEYLQKEYDITDYLLITSEKKPWETIKTKLFEVKDISKWNRQIFLKKISPKCFYQFHKNLQIIFELYNYNNTDNTISSYFNSHHNITNYDKIPTFCNLLIELIDKNININDVIEIDQIVNFEDNFIKKGVDNELDEKTEILMDSSNKLEAIRVYFNSLLTNYEKKSKTTEYFKIHETEKNSFSLIGTKKRCSILKTILAKDDTTQHIELNYISSYTGQNKKFIFNCLKNVELLIQSTSNNSIINPDIYELCKNISSIKIQMKDILSRVYQAFIEKFEAYQEEIESIIEYITLVDIIYSKASVARKYNYCKPEIDNNVEKSYVNVNNLRHCLIEHLQQNEIYVTNDIILGKKLEKDGILLYGTNAVGKTSFIRALGISVIMAQSGLYVPASNFIYKPYKYIFTRILGNDNLFKGMSSFATEMSELRTILRLANKDSLILGDELCSGTESISAISIFVAGIKTLHEKNCSFIFATHLHEIINYDEITQLQNLGLKHMAIIYDREKDILIYDRKLRDGPGDNMYGLEVCKSLNLPDDFLNMANEIRMKYYPGSNSILSLKTSHYNSKKIINLCEKCGKSVGTEVHHLQHQNMADENGILKGTTTHKNHKANLMTLCEKCHDNIHKKKTQHKKVKTFEGYALTDI